eukprot:gene5141-5381_t
MLAARLGCDFYDADSYHSEHNINKMRSGIPLNDEDRWPWLQQLAAILRQHVVQGTRAVLACSALKQVYRQFLASGATGGTVAQCTIAAGHGGSAALTEEVSSYGTTNGLAGSNDSQLTTEDTVVFELKAVESTITAGSAAGPLFIEKELRNKGYAYEDDNAEADNPHQTLIGALRVEARVKEQETQKRLFNIKRVVCIGGGVALVLLAWALLIASSRDRTDPEYQAALAHFEGETPQSIAARMKAANQPGSEVSSSPTLSSKTDQQQEQPADAADSKQQQEQPKQKKQPEQKQDSDKGQVAQQSTAPAANSTIDNSKNSSGDAAAAPPQIPAANATQNPANISGNSSAVPLNASSSAVPVNASSSGSSLPAANSTVQQLLQVGVDALHNSHLADHVHGSAEVTQELPPATPPEGTLSHWRLLLEALCPLTHSAASETDELAPHSQPKAQELFKTLVKGVQDRPWYMISPNGTFRQLWDLLMFVFSAGLVLYIPVLIAFFDGRSECTYVSGFSTLQDDDSLTPVQRSSGVVFLTITNMAFLVDIMLNFLTGVCRFNKDTALVEVVWDLPVVAKVYCKTWLLIDVLSCLPMECIVAAATPGMTNCYNLPHLNSQAEAPWSRGLLMIAVNLKQLPPAAGHPRLQCRLLKAVGWRRRAHGDPFRFINRLPCLRDNFNYSLRLVIKSASLLLLGLHYFACALWFVLRLQGFPDQSWPVQLHLLDNSSVYQWWTWSVFAVTSAMIGLGYGSYPPVSFPEAVLWILEMIFMAAGFAVVNGFILSAILEALAGQARTKAKLMQARKAGERHGLPDRLKRQVINYFQLKYMGGMGDPGDSVMSELEPGLQLQVAVATVGCHLRRLLILRDTPQLLQRMCLIAQQQIAAEGQVLAIPGTPQKQLCIIVRGYADLYMGELLIDTLAAGDSFGETALLPVPPSHQQPAQLSQLWSNSKTFSNCRWPTLFAVRALSNCTLLVLDADAFFALLREYSWAEQQFQELGRRHAAVLADLPILPQLWEKAASWDALKDPADATIQAYSKHSHIAAAVHSHQSTLGPTKPVSMTGSLDRPAHLGLIHRSLRDSGRRVLSALTHSERSHSGNSSTDGGAGSAGHGTSAVV